MDDLDLSIQRRIDDDPGYREMLEAEVRRQRLIGRLVEQRKSNRLTQADVAQAMRVSQPAVSEIESAKADVRVSTLERYASAVSGHGVHLEFVPD